MHKDQLRKLALDVSGIKRRSSYTGQRKLNKILNPVIKSKATNHNVNMPTKDKQEHPKGQ